MERGHPVLYLLNQMKESLKARRSRVQTHLVLSWSETNLTCKWILKLDSCWDCRRNAVDGVKGGKNGGEKKAGVAGALNDNTTTAAGTSANEQFMKYYNKELKV